MSTESLPSCGFGGWLSERVDKVYGAARRRVGSRVDRLAIGLRSTMYSNVQRLMIENADLRYAEPRCLACLNQHAAGREEARPMAHRSYWELA